MMTQLKGWTHLSKRENIGSVQRLASIAGGAYLLWSALSILTSKKKPEVLSPAWNAITGSYLIYRGLSGHCIVKEAINRSEDKILSYLHHN